MQELQDQEGQDGGGSGDRDRQALHGRSADPGAWCALRDSLL
jgi:hypothetical protein